MEQWIYQGHVRQLGQYLLKFVVDSIIWTRSHRRILLPHRPSSPNSQGLLGFSTAACRLFKWYILYSLESTVSIEEEKGFLFLD